MRYSQMTHDELHEEIRHLNEDINRSRHEGMISECAVLERKRDLARSYLLLPIPQTVPPVTTVRGEAGTFKIRRCEGVMAWGTFDDSSEEKAFPIALLGCFQSHEL